LWNSWDDNHCILFSYQIHLVYYPCIPLRIYFHSHRSTCLSTNVPKSIWQNVPLISIPLFLLYLIHCVSRLWTLPQICSHQDWSTCLWTNQRRIRYNKRMKISKTRLRDSTLSIHLVVLPFSFEYPSINLDKLTMPLSNRVILLHLSFISTIMILPHWVSIQTNAGVNSKDNFIYLINTSLKIHLFTIRMHVDFCLFFVSEIELLINPWVLLFSFWFI